jgi:hypothetical protein
MDGISVYSEDTRTTLVPNEFIDYYMPRANGTFVKVYIYKLWDFAVLVAVFITVYAIVLLLMRCYSVKHGGVSEVSEQITAYGIKGFSLDKLQLKTEAVQWIRISRTPFDKRHGHCTVKLRATGKNRDTVKVKYLDYHDCVSFFEDLCRQ